MNSLVLDNPNEFVQNINYAHKVINSSDETLKYSMNLRSESNFEAYQSRMNSLKEYIFIPGIEELVKTTKERVDKFLSLKTIDSEFVD